MYKTNNFLEELIKKVKPKHDLLSCSKEEIESEKEAKKVQLNQVLRLEELYKLFSEALVYSEEKSEEKNHYQQIKYSVNGIHHLPFPVYVLKPNKNNGKTVIYLHGHDDLGVMGALLERHDKERFHHMFPITLVKLGYTVVAPECMGFGEGYYQYSNEKPSEMSGCFMNEGILSMCGFNIIGIRTMQVMKTIDFILEEQLSDDISLFGVSGGALTGTMVSVLDNRVKRIALAAYPNSYKGSILKKDHCVENYIPGIFQMGDSYQILSLAAPKPLLVVNGKYDRGFTIEGSIEAIAYLEKVYERMNLKNRFKGILFEGKHEISVSDVVEWLDKF